MQTPAPCRGNLTELGHRRWFTGCQHSAPPHRVPPQDHKHHVNSVVCGTNPRSMSLSTTPRHKPRLTPRFPAQPPRRDTTGGCCGAPGPPLPLSRRPHCGVARHTRPAHQHRGCSAPGPRGAPQRPEERCGSGNRATAPFLPPHPGRSRRSLLGKSRAHALPPHHRLPACIAGGGCARASS